MRGTDQDPATISSDVSPGARIPADHPLRATREMTNRALARLDRKFRKLYSRMGRPSVAPEQLLRALLLQALYSIRSERMLIEQLEYNQLFRWFVGLEMDDRVWDGTVFTKNRNRLLEGEIAESIGRRSCVFGCQPNLEMSGFLPSRAVGFRIASCSDATSRASTHTCARAHPLRRRSCSASRRCVQCSPRWKAATAWSRRRSTASACGSSSACGCV